MSFAAQALFFHLVGNAIHPLAYLGKVQSRQFIFRPEGCYQTSCRCRPEEEDPVVVDLEEEGRLVSYPEVACHQGDHLGVPLVLAVRQAGHPLADHPLVLADR